MLGAAAYGDASGTATITCTDGTTQDFPLTFADWWSVTPASGGDLLTTLPYVNRNGGRVDHTVGIYSASAHPQPGKTVRYLTLPDVSSGTPSGLSTQVFAVGLG